MEASMRHPVPIGATVSRRTGEVKIQWGDDREAQLLFGKIMNGISRSAEWFEYMKVKGWRESDAERGGETSEKRKDVITRSPAEIAAGCATREAALTDIP